MNLRTIVVLALLPITAPAWGHDVVNGPNGGPVVDAGAHHIELVVKGNSVNVFVTDTNSKPVSVAGFKGVAILTVAGKAQRIVLESTDGTRLSGSLPVPISGSPHGVVQLTGPDGKTAQGRFN